MFKSYVSIVCILYNAPWALENLHLMLFIRDFLLLHDFIQFLTKRLFGFFPSLFCQLPEVSSVSSYCLLVEYHSFSWVIIQRGLSS